ncbi:MAG TPA: EVE domain-containing protein [Candidatus Xenobia bacterium]|nr:EVE domain-containing protein [Candidatus Xenobia bacterium]
MPQYWLFLSDPESYHYDELFEKKRDVWDGVFGSMAQRHIAEIRKGDRILGYHTAPEKSVYCELRAASGPYQNPELKEKNLVLEVAAVRKLKRPVSLAELKSNPKLKGMRLFKFFRPIAVSPLTEAEYQEILRLGSR